MADTYTAHFYGAKRGDDVEGIPLAELDAVLAPLVAHGLPTIIAPGTAVVLTRDDAR